MVRRVIKSVALLGVFVASGAYADFMPKNDLDKEDNPFVSNGITQEEFNAVIDEAEAVYEPILDEQHGASLNVNRLWSNGTVNASAYQSGSTWYVNMYGGLARRKEITKDGFALVLCHEIGHHLAGFPFVSYWAANEGQSDYFATLSCARMLWSDETEKNAESRATVPEKPKTLCDGIYTVEADQNLCYRTMMASKSISDLLAALGRSRVNYDTPDDRVVSRTDHDHPAAQCRLDTYMAGALCVASFDPHIIPGKDASSRNGREAEEESAQYTCSSSNGYEVGVRPACWFKSGL